MRWLASMTCESLLGNLKFSLFVLGVLFLPPPPLRLMFLAKFTPITFASSTHVCQIINQFLTFSFRQIEYFWLFKIFIHNLFSLKFYFILKISTFLKIIIVSVQGAKVLSSTCIPSVLDVCIPEFYLICLWNVLYVVLIVPYLVLDDTTFWPKGPLFWPTYLGWMIEPHMNSIQGMSMDWKHSFCDGFQTRRPSQNKRVLGFQCTKKIIYRDHTI